MAQAGNSVGRGALLQPGSITGPRSAVPHSLSLSCGPRSMWSCAGRFLLGVGPLPLQGCALTRAWPSHAVSQGSRVCMSGCGICPLTLPSLPTPVRPSSPSCPTRISPRGRHTPFPTSGKASGMLPRVPCLLWVFCGCPVSESSATISALLRVFIMCGFKISYFVSLEPVDIYGQRITCCCPISEGPHQGLESG